MKYVSFFALFFVPSLAFAQGIQQYVTSIPQLLNTTVIPFLLGIGFLFVVINIVRYFVIASTKPEGRETAKQYILYSILAFVLILVFWGIISLLVNATGLSGVTQPVPDYYSAFGSSNNGNNTNNSSTPPPTTPTPTSPTPSTPTPSTPNPTPTRASTGCTDIGGGMERCSRTISLSTPRRPGESCTPIQGTNNSDRQRCVWTQPLGSSGNSWWDIF